MVAFSSFSEPTDRVRHQQPNTTVYVNNNNIGKGTLFISESYLSWCSDSGNGFTLEYPHISLHAISRDLTAFSEECIFMMLDTDFSGETENNSFEDGDSGDQVTTELRLVPDDRGMLDAMFNALNICQTLHPDPEDSFSDEDFFEDANEDANEDVNMEETDSQMANMRIRNTDEITHKNFVGPDRICDMRNMRDNYLMNNDLRNKIQDTVGADLENFADDIFEDTVENKQRNTENIVGAQQGIAVGRQDIAVGQQGIAVGQPDVAVGQQDVVVEQEGIVGEGWDIVGQRGIAVGQRGIAVGQRGIAVGQQDTFGCQDVEQLDDVGQLDVVGRRDVGQQGAVVGQEGIVGEGWDIAVGQRDIAVGQQDTFGCQDVVEDGFGNYSGYNLDGMGQDGKSSS